MEPFAFILASAAFLVALIAWVRASGCAVRLDDIRSDARREASNAREELGAALEVQKQLLARLADGESITKEMVHEGQLFQDVNGQFAEKLYAAGGLYVLDVREPNETAGGVLPGAKEIPVDSIPERFGEASIQRYSTVMNQQFDSYIPSWLGSTVQLNELQDESEIL